MRFIDLDRLIEKRESTTIKEIFKEKGEKYFRDLERKMALKKLKKLVKKVWNKYVEWLFKGAK